MPRAATTFIRGIRDPEPGARPDQLPDHRGRAESWPARQSKGGQALYSDLPAQERDRHSGRDPNGQRQRRNRILGGGGQARDHSLRSQRSGRGGGTYDVRPRRSKDARQLPVCSPAGRRSRGASRQCPSPPSFESKPASSSICCSKTCKATFSGSDCRVRPSGSNRQRDRQGQARNRPDQDHSARAENRE